MPKARPNGDGYKRISDVAKRAAWKIASVPAIRGRPERNPSSAKTTPSGATRHPPRGNSQADVAAKEHTNKDASNAPDAVEPDRAVEPERAAEPGGGGDAESEPGAKGDPLRIGPGVTERSGPPILG